MRKAILNPTFAAFTAFFATGCLDNQEGSPMGPYSRLISSKDQKTAFKAGRDLWTDTMPSSYSFELSRNCLNPSIAEPCRSGRGVPDCRHTPREVINR